MTEHARSTAFGALTSPEAAEARGSLVVVPIGAVEQHGPHLPLATDIWIASAVARDAVARVDDAFLADPLPVGCSVHHRSFPGTLSLGVDTFIRMICDVATCLFEDGFVPVFVNGHGGNRAPMGAALQRLLEQNVSAWGLTYFETLRDVAIERFGGRALGHACALETSISQHLWPELVGELPAPGAGDSEVFPDPSLFSTDPAVRHRRFEEFNELGLVGDPARADPEWGEDVYETAVLRVAEQLRRISTSKRA